MSVAGWHKTFMAPFHTLIPCDIPFVLFRLDFEHDLSHCVLSRASIQFVASKYPNSQCKKWQLLHRRRHVTASPGGITALFLQTRCFYESPVASLYIVAHF